ncbi:MAG TPA: HDOD domain-containing protein [Tepidisphaeraceae bacterium]|nr:HDOD domain-containing protein [Tepidisphaeraceae bacterium]
MPASPDLQKEKRVELILQQLEELPTLPAVAVRVLEATGSDDASAKDVVKLIQTDVSLTARILQLVHRSDLGVRGEVASVERAVVLMGFEAVRSAVLAVSVFDTLGATEARDSRFSRDEFWKHSVAVACCAELLAEQLAALWERDCGVTPADAFVAGLLHDMGKVALDAVLPKSFSKVIEAVDLLRGNIADVERSVIGIDHMTAGKRLAERWQLPAQVRDAIWLHGQLPQALPPSVRNPRLVNLVTLADQLVREQHLGYSGNYAFTVSRQALLDAVALTPDGVDKVMRKLVERIEPRASSLGLGQDTSSELYRQAITRANKELGRVTSQLATRNRKLVIRAKFFDALSRFQGELRPDAPAQAVLKAVGQTALEVVGGAVVAAFSLPPGQLLAEAVLLNAQGEVFDTTLIDCPPDRRPARPQEGEGPVMPAGQPLDWLIEAVSPRLADEHRFWICLEADGQCVGGVVWGAAAGEAQRLSTQVQELTAIAGGWSLALRTAQIREEARTLSEQLAGANRRLQTAQVELLRTKTMGTVGEMAAGAAHEMNNPLAVISGRSQLLSTIIADPKQKAMAHLVYEQAQRLSDIITELMAFAKPVPPKPAECDLADLVGRALHEAKSHDEVADRRIEVTCADVPPVVVDPEQVGAAVAEVLGNAIQATDPKRGHVTVHVAHDPYSAKVVLTIADDGCGMDEPTLKRAFDPFFSSRPAGRRRGMGLAKALRWVESSGGGMRLESKPGQGTRTTFLLPAAPATSAAPQQPASERRRLA